MPTPILECPVCGGVMIPGSIHRCPISGPRAIDEAYLKSGYYQGIMRECRIACGLPADTVITPEPQDG